MLGTLVAELGQMRWMMKKEMVQPFDTVPPSSKLDLKSTD